MTDAELHAFGIDSILPFLNKEGVTVEAVNHDLKKLPQIVGRRWNALAFIYVRTACYPNHGTLSAEQFQHAIDWAHQHKAEAFFASVGVACTNYPDKEPVTLEEHTRLPIRNAGFAINYEGLLIMTMLNNLKQQN